MSENLNRACFANPRHRPAPWSGGGRLALLLIGLLAADLAGVRVASAESFEVEPQLRPCCAFGYDLRTRVGEADLSATIGNVFDPSQIGKHSYLATSLPEEINGLAYSCRGGFIDLAHVRDNADRTAYLVHRLVRVLGSSAVLGLYEEGGPVELVVRLPSTPLDVDERWELALALGQRIAFDLSVWHEIATWYGYESMPGFSERVSAFSPEDLYSNALGARVGVEALRSGGSYDQQAAAGIAHALREVWAVPARQTREALDSVEGRWWDRRRMLPDPRAVTRRNLDIADSIRPWLVPGQGPESCRDDASEPLLVEIPQRDPSGLALEDLVELRIRIDRQRMPDFPADYAERPWVSSRDFADLVARVRQGVRSEFGPHGDQRELDLDALGLRSVQAKAYDEGSPCGAADPDCSLTLGQELHGLRIGKLWAGGGTQSGPWFGGSLVEMDGAGGGFAVFSIDALIDVSHRDFSFRLRAVETKDILYFCQVDSGDGSGQTVTDFPFINPFSARCKPSASWGVRVNLWDSFHDSGTGRSVLKPVDFSVAVNLLGNGRTAAGASRRFVLDLGLAPTSLQTADLSTTALTAHFGISWTHAFAHDRFELTAFGQVFDDLLSLRDVGVEAGLRFGTHLLWSRRDLRNDQALHSLFSLGLELGAQYWSDPDKAFPGRLRVFPMTRANVLPGVSGGAFVVMLFVETTIPKLGLF
jgi:hypothetical protein